MYLNKRTIALALSFCVAPLSHAAWNETVLDTEGLPAGASFRSLAMNNVGGFAVGTTANEGYVFTYETWARLKGDVRDVTGMNDLGQITGDVVQGVYKGVVWSSSGPRKDIGMLPGYGDSSAQSINNAGVVVGGSGMQGWGANSQVGVAGSAPSKVIAGDEGSAAWDINNHGVITGTAAVVGEPGMTGVYTAKDGVVSYIAKDSYPGVIYYNRSRINDDGDVSYNAIYAGGDFYNQTAFLRESNGSVLTLSAAGYSHSRAFDVNASGDVLGAVWNGDTWSTVSNSRLVLWHNGVSQFIGDEGVYGSQWLISAFNDQGQVLTTRYTPFGQSLVLLTPAVPEPSTWALMLCGVGMMGAMARRRTKLS